MTLRTSLIITGDGKVAKAEVDAVRGSIDQTGATAAKVAPQLRQMDLALDGVSTSAKSAAFGLSSLSEPSAALIRQQRQAADAAGKLTGNLGLQRAGYQQLGFQLQDVAASYASGTRLSTIFAQQAGQAGSAIGLIAQGSENASSRMGKLASVISGPWGIAATVAISLGAALWNELSKVDDASADAAKSSIDFSNSLITQQNVVANSTDGIKQLEEATRGLINTQALLLDNLQAVSKASVGQLETQLAGIDKQIADQSDIANSLSGRLSKLGLFGNSDVVAEAEIARLRTEREKVAQNLATARSSLSISEVALEERAAIERADPDARAKGEIERKRAELRRRRQYTLDLQRGDVPLADAPSLEQVSKAEFDRDMGELQRRENALKDRRKPKKDNSAAKALRDAERLAQFGERAEDAIGRLNDQFNDAPRDIDQARQATAKLDDIIADLEKRKPKNFETLIAQAQAIKPLIRDSLQRPLRDMLDDQQKQIDLGALQLSGRQADADALNLTYGLMQKIGVETQDQLAVELAKRGVTGDQVAQLYDNLDVMREQTRELQKQQQMQQAFLGAIGDMRENVRLTIQDLRQEGPKALGDFAKRSLDVFDRLFSEVATEKLFGGLFRDLEDQITGGDKVSDAGKRMAAAVDRASADIKKTSKDILALGDAAAIATAKMEGKSAPVVSDAIGAVVPSAGAPSQEPADIVVTALKSNFRTGFEGVFDDLNKGLKGLFTDIFGDRGLFSTSLAKTLGQVAGNAALGGTAGSLATGLLGIKGSGTGGMLGGAIGGAIGKEVLGSLGSFAGPLGAIAGGVLGSVVGGLFKKSKTGSATIGNVDGAGAVTGTSGNSAEYRKQSAGMAGNVLNSLDQIVQQLGGTLGNFSVSVGYKKSSEPYRVDTTGQGRTKGSGVLYFTDEAEAQAAALANAIADGAVGGVSEAVRRALASSDDVSKAVQEALKVQEVETLLGGIGSEMAQAFKALEAQAKERVRIANQYGFDVVAIEKKNAEDRVKLVDQILADRVGSLQSLLDDLSFGNLAEGSVMDQRTKLLAEIAKARSDAEAGVDGAADKLATLSRSLVDLSRDKLGTAGSEYSADRDTASQAAQAVIAAEKSRIAAASGEQAQTNAKLDETNKTLDELADQQAKGNATLDAILQALNANVGTGTPPAGGGSGMLREYYRMQEL